MNFDRKTFSKVAGVLVFSLVLGISAVSLDDSNKKMSPEDYGISSSAGASAAFDDVDITTTAGANGAVDEYVGVIDVVPLKANTCVVFVITEAILPLESALNVSFSFVNNTV